MKFDMAELLKWFLDFLSGIFSRVDEGVLAWIFGKGAELVDENKDKLNNTDGE